MPFWSRCALRMNRARRAWLIRVTSAWTGWSDRLSQQSDSWTTQKMQQCHSGLCRLCFQAVREVQHASIVCARVPGLLLVNLVNIAWLLVTQLLWCGHRLINRPRTGRIQHIFVLMLENRSFDHLLGLAQIEGIDASSGQATVIEGLNAQNNWNVDLQGKKVLVSAPAAWVMPHDPGHEFPDVREQLCGTNGNYPHITSSGFVTNYSRIDAEHPAEIMKCYTAEQLPVLNTLAREFAICDHWFASMPGPTWPNRFFIHAASSGGLDHSPTRLDTASAILFNGYKFANGTIYDRLDDEGLDWVIYKGDAFPQSLAISGMDVRALEGHFKDFADFSRNLHEKKYRAFYTFIEPSYGRAMSDFTCGDSQHPQDDVTRGERLIKTVYEAVRRSPHWENSLLIITYDEHGGFYDHVPPPQAAAPGDAFTDPENNRYGFDFTQLGVRVPTVAISPLIPKGSIDHTVYDHTSVLATIEDMLGIQSLTERDRSANTLQHLLSLPAPRTDAPLTLPEPASSELHCDGETLQFANGTPVLTKPATANVLFDSSREGFLHIALRRDLQVSAPAEKEQKIKTYQSITTHEDAKQYIHEVQQRVKQLY